VCHGTLTVVRSSSSQRMSRSRWPRQSTRRLWSQAVAVAALVSSKTEVVLDGGKEYTAVEAVEAMRPHCSHCSRQSRRSHCSRRRGGPTALTAMRSRCSHCSTEARGGPRGGPRRSGNSVRPRLPRRASVSMARSEPNVPKSRLRFFFIFEKRFWVLTGNSRYEK
jgi:hypothetical protein